METQWERILELAPLVSLSLPQRMSHLFLLYRAYYTLQKLFRFVRRQDYTCPRCGRAEGDLIHMFWRCPRLFQYWREVVGIIGQVFEVSIDLETMLCVLGWIEGEGKLGDAQLAILRCLFQARKLIAQKWQSTISPSSREWEQGMNVVILNHLPPAI